MQTKKIIRIALVTTLVLLIPLIAMQFTDEVVWDLADFVIAGAMLFGTGVAYELVASRGGSRAYRAAVGLAVVGALMLVWMNLAVGLIGNEENPANLMYIGVLATGAIGALIARFQPQGMARTLLAMALAQMLIAVIAQVVGLGFTYIINGFFAALWVGSAWLFHRAGATGSGVKQMT